MNELIHLKLKEAEIKEIVFNEVFDDKLRKSVEKLKGKKIPLDIDYVTIVCNEIIDKLMHTNDLMHDILSGKELTVWTLKKVVLSICIHVDDKHIANPKLEFDPLLITNFVLLLSALVELHRETHQAKKYADNIYICELESMNVTIELYFIRNEFKLCIIPKSTWVFSKTYEEPEIIKEALNLIHTLNTTEIRGILHDILSLKERSLKEEFIRYFIARGKLPVSIWKLRHVIITQPDLLRTLLFAQLLKVRK